jgi:heme exporter protein A
MNVHTAAGYERPIMHLTGLTGDRIVAGTLASPRASSMPQTTIYVSPRSIGEPDTRPPAVLATDLARLFAASPALVDVSIEIGAARVVVLRGPNGAGKTTLLRILATAIRPSLGSALVDGLDVVRDADQLRPRVSYLAHATGLYDDLTAAENLRFAATMLGTPDRAERVRRALDDVGLGSRADERVVTFSAGMRRRLALGRLLLGSPSLVLLDEPYATLDPDGMALVDELLDAWRAAGVTVLIASHAADRIADRSDGWVRLEAGVVTEISGPAVRIPARASTAPDATPAATAPSR